ncbi:MAG: YidH family protein [Syntrophobacteraceae bacterium]
MSNVAFRFMSDALRNCCSGVKAFLFTRWSLGSDRKSAAAYDINCDLSDKNTFFAWQRNHMANERTFLSWCRTGISLIGFGFLIERFDVIIREMQFIALPGINGHMNHVPSTRYLGMVALGLGVVIIVLAGWRFYYIRKHINTGDPRFSVVPDTFLLSSVLLTVAAAFVFFAFYF